MTELSLVERLRERARWYPLSPGSYAPDSVSAALFNEAADALAEQAAVREELCGALRPFARLGEDDVLTAIANVASPFSFIQFTDNNGGKLHKLDFADLHRARAILAKATPEKETK